MKGTLEIIQMSLSALQSAVNLVSSKLDEKNKAVKDLTDSMASVQMMVDNVKLRLEQCEKKVTEAQVSPKRNNLIIFGLQAEKNESHSTTFGILEKFLKEKMDLEIAEWHVDMANRLGRGRDNRPIMVRLTTFRKTFWKTRRNWRDQKLGSNKITHGKPDR
jgi:chromosome segregation ATPase